MSYTICSFNFYLVGPTESKAASAVWRPIERRVGQLVDAGIQYGQDFRKQFITAVFYSFCATSAEINRFNLFHHNETSEFTSFGDGDVKWETTLCVCNRAYNSQPSASIE